MVLSRLPLTICRLSAEKATLKTSFLWLTNCRVLVPTDKSQRRNELSHEPLTAKRPSLEMTTSETKCEWPRKALLGTPHDALSLDESCWLFNCQMIMDLSREAERTMSGYCGVVAIWVTQPLWPTRTPFKASCSPDKDILICFFRLVFFFLKTKRNRLRSNKFLKWPNARLTEQTNKQAISNECRLTLHLRDPRVIWTNDLKIRSKQLDWSRRKTFFFKRDYFHENDLIEGNFTWFSSNFSLISHLSNYFGSGDGASV